MDDIYPYVRVCLFEKFPSNVTLASSYIEDHELADVFRSYFLKTLEDFGVADKLPIEDYTWLIFDELREKGHILHMADPKAGEYFWADLQKVANYMRSQLQDNEIFARRKMLKGDRFYEAVFRNLGSENASGPTEVGRVFFSEGDPAESFGQEGDFWFKVAPASDGVVPLDHNSASYTNAVAATGDLATALQEGNDVGDLSVEEVSAAKTELQSIQAEINAEVVRPKAFWDRARSLLTWISRKAAEAVIGGLALAALAAIGVLLGVPIP